MYSSINSYESKPNTCFIIDRHVVNWPGLPCISPKDIDLFNCHDLSPKEPVFVMTTTRHVRDTDKHVIPTQRVKAQNFHETKQTSSLFLLQFSLSRFSILIPESSYPGLQKHPHSCLITIPLRTSHDGSTQA